MFEIVEQKGLNSDKGHLKKNRSQFLRLWSCCLPDCKHPFGRRVVEGYWRTAPLSKTGKPVFVFSGENNHWASEMVRKVSVDPSQLSLRHTKASEALSEKNETRPFGRTP